MAPAMLDPTATQTPGYMAPTPSPPRSLYFERGIDTIGPGSVPFSYMIRPSLAYAPSNMHAPPFSLFRYRSDMVYNLHGMGLQ